MVIGVLIIPFATELSKPVKHDLVINLLDKRADFRVTLKYLLNHEGYYVNHPNDYGLETYAGISRRYNPDSKIWKKVDQYKRQNRVKWNDSIPGLKYLVIDYYVSIWVKEDFFYIQDQDIANYTMDIRVNSEKKGVKIIQEALNSVNLETPITGKMDIITVNNLNKVNKWQFLCILMSKRIELYTKIVNRSPNQIIFMKHWISRVKI